MCSITRYHNGSGISGVYIYSKDYKHCVAVASSSKYSAPHSPVTGPVEIHAFSEVELATAGLSLF
jgi:hypothetical protein